MTFRELIKEVPESDYDLPLYISDRCDNCYSAESVMRDRIESEEDWEKGKPGRDPGYEFIRIGC